VGTIFWDNIFPTIDKNIAIRKLFPILLGYKQVLIKHFIVQQLEDFMANKKLALALALGGLALFQAADAANAEIQASDLVIRARGLYTKFYSSSVSPKALSRLIGEINPQNYVNDMSKFAVAPTDLQGFLERLTNIAEDLRGEAVSQFNVKLNRIEKQLNKMTQSASGSDTAGSEA
jgi:hypothetical protein